jgi:hypothetical protein
LAKGNLRENLDHVYKQHHQSDTSPQMMEAQMVSETSGFNPQLTWLVAQQDFTEFNCHESSKSYTSILSEQLFLS